jgi:hypothetical protein
MGRFRVGRSDSVAVGRGMRFRDGCVDGMQDADEGRENLHDLGHWGRFGNHISGVSLVCGHIVLQINSFLEVFRFAYNNNRY